MAQCEHRFSVDMFFHRYMDFSQNKFFSQSRFGSRHWFVSRVGTFVAMLLLGVLFSGSGIHNHEGPEEVELDAEQFLLESLDAFYETEWGKTEELLQLYLERHPNDPRPHFFRSMIPFWEYFFVEQSEETASSFLKLSSIALGKSENRLKETPSDTTSVLLMSALHGYRSLVAAGEGEYQIAIKSGVRGFSFTRQLMGMNSDRPEVKMGRGLFYYMIGSVGREARWLVNSLGVSADTEMGFDELMQAAASPDPVSTDAGMMLMYLYDKEERYAEALEMANRLIEKHPGNKIFHFKRGEIMESLDRIEEAQKSYQRVMDSDSRDLQGLNERAKARINQLHTSTLINER